MTIKVGDRLPEAKFRVMTADGPAWKTTDDVFKGKLVALFAAPGAYTGVCHRQHLPSIIGSADALKAKGVQSIAVVTVNDVFVQDAWKRDIDPKNQVEFLADGNADFTKAVGLDIDMTAGGLGVRSKRYSMLVSNGVVKELNIEDNPGTVEKSAGGALLKQL
ncbi:MAG: peroxiredoxin [Xanthobacteraceae bacterium]|nr:MAG: peroxiredoxin [Xanthobacteraceae bacterium]